MIIIKSNKEGRRIFKELTESDDFREIIKDKEQFLLINNNGAIFAECTLKMTEFLEENNIITLGW